jgi:hypothetical protein
MPKEKEWLTFAEWGRKFGESGEDSDRQLSLT